MIFNQSDRLMIGHMVGLDKAGIYNVAYSLSILLSFVINAINSSYIPWLYGNLKSKIFAPINKVTISLVMLVSFLLLSLMFVAPEIIVIMAGNPYKEAIWVIPPIVASQLFLFLSQLSINIMFFYEDSISLVKGSILSAILNLVLNYFFIQKFGYIAAGYTTLISYVVFWLSNLYYMNKKCTKLIDNYKIDTIYKIKYIIAVSIIFLITMAIIMILYNFLILRYAIIMIVLLVLVIFHKKILMRIKHIKKGEVYAKN